MRKLLAVIVLALTFGAGAATAATYESIVTPMLQACMIVREAELHGIDPQTKLPIATHACTVLGRFTRPVR